MKILQEEAITFDDVTLVPNYSTIKSRKDPDIRKWFLLESGKEFYLDIPVFAAPMNTVCEKQMSDALISMGGMGVIHRYMSIEEQVKQISSFELAVPFFAIGATGDFLERATELHKKGIDSFCIDVANGDSEVCLEAVTLLKNKFDCFVMAGNVCTKEGFIRLAQRGTDFIRVGVGSGAMCKTRTVTGHGVPQLTALMWAKEAQNEFPKTAIISDGGIRNSGDIVKAMTLADYVMLGSLLAGTDEAPGEVVVDYRNGKEYKLYAGMASEDGRSLNNWFDRTKTAFVPEGESVMLKYKGSVKNVINELMGGLKVGMSYSGASNLSELREKATFIRVTNNGMIEGTPHGKLLK